MIITVTKPNGIKRNIEETQLKEYEAKGYTQIKKIIEEPKVVTVEKPKATIEKSKK